MYQPVAADECRGHSRTRHGRGTSPTDRAASQLRTHRVPGIEGLDVVILTMLLCLASHPSEAVELDAILKIRSRVVVCRVKVTDLGPNVEPHFLRRCDRDDPQCL